MAKQKLPDGMWKRGRTYYARFRAGGREIRKKLSTNLQAAIEILNDLKSRADKADFNIIDNDYPWATLKAEFITWAKQAVRNPAEYERDLEWFEEHAKPRTVRDVTHQAVFAYREWRACHRYQRKGHRAKANGKPISARTINKEIGTVSHMLNKAIEWGKIGSNPLAGLKPLRHDTVTKQRRSLSTEEVLAIFEASPDYLKPVWRMFVTTGIRLMELVDMRFADVDFEGRTVTVRAGTAKNHKERTIPLDDAMLATITELRAAAPHRQAVKGKTAKQTAQQAARLCRESVFVSRANTPLTNNVLTRFYAVCAKAKIGERTGIEGAHRGGSVDVHSLRVSFATLAIEGGANVRALMTILGHGSVDLTLRLYTKATDKAKREAINALPFASTSGPDHVLPLETAHKMRTSRRTNDKGADVG